jgi:hypothetical protein
MSITGSSSCDGKEVVPVVMRLQELAPVGRGHQKPTATHSLNPCPLAHDRASKSSLACSIPSRLRWHS